MLDEDHTTLQSLNPGLVQSSKYWVTAHCTICRTQLTVLLTLNTQSAFRPCPSSNSPLHHFLPLDGPSESIATLTGVTQPEKSRSVQEFTCTSSSCTAVLQVVYRSSRLNPNWVKLLTDPALIQARAEQAIASDPDRFEGYAIPTGAEVLSNLRAYLLNGLRSPEPKVINGANKRWLLSLGEPCKELLEYLGFEKKVACMLSCTFLINNYEQGIDWVCPAPGPATTPLLIESLHNKLNHVEKEILILLSKRSSEERKAIKVDATNESPLTALRKLLGTTKCMVSQQHKCHGANTCGRQDETRLATHRSNRGRSSVRRSTIWNFIVIENQWHTNFVCTRFYAGLGVVGDFHDELIVFAYDRQIATDPANLAYYLECLQGICDGRDGPADLQTKVLLEQTADKVSGRDLRSAYRKLGVNDSLPDETILGTFQARLVDAPSHQEEELREALKMIGTYRKSKRLREAASMGKSTSFVLMSVSGIAAY